MPHHTYFSHHFIFILILCFITCVSFVFYDQIEWVSVYLFICGYICFLCLVGEDCFPSFLFSFLPFSTFIPVLSTLGSVSSMHFCSIVSLFFICFTSFRFYFSYKIAFPSFVLSLTSYLFHFHLFYFNFSSVPLVRLPSYHSYLHFLRRYFIFICFYFNFVYVPLVSLPSSIFFAFLFNYYCPICDLCTVWIFCHSYFISLYFISVLRVGRLLYLSCFFSFLCTSLYIVRFVIYCCVLYVFLCHNCFVSCLISVWRVRSLDYMPSSFLPSFPYISFTLPSILCALGSLTCKYFVSKLLCFCQI